MADPGMHSEGSFCGAGEFSGGRKASQALIKRAERESNVPPPNRKIHNRPRWKHSHGWSEGYWGRRSCIRKPIIAFFSLSLFLIPQEHRSVFFFQGNFSLKITEQLTESGSTH